MRPVQSSLGESRIERGFARHSVTSRPCREQHNRLPPINIPFLQVQRRRKLFDVGILAYDVVDAVAAGVNINDTIKAMQRALPSKDKLLDLKDNPSRLATDAKMPIPPDHPKQLHKTNMYLGSEDKLKAEIVSVLTAVSKHLQGNPGIKVRGVLRKLTSVRPQNNLRTTNMLPRQSRQCKCMMR